MLRHLAHQHDLWTQESNLVLPCAQEKQKQVRSRDSGSKASASEESTEAQDMKVLRQYAASRTDMTDIAAALTEDTRQPTQHQPQSRSGLSASALEKSAPSGEEQAPTPLTRDGAVEALAERCKQSLGLTEAQVGTTRPHIAHLRRPSCGAERGCAHFLHYTPTSVPVSVFLPARLCLSFCPRTFLSQFCIHRQVLPSCSQFSDG